MMNKIPILLAFFVAIQIAAHSQALYYQTYDFYQEYVCPEKVEEDKVILAESEVVEFAFEGNYLSEFYSRHVVEYIGSETGAVINFKKYISMSIDSEVLEAKAKVIKPDKKEIVLDKSKILSSTDEETGAQETYFALEGLAKGDIIDYYYVVKKYPDYHGAYKNIQTNYPIYKYSFKLFAPGHLMFGFKVLNDTAKVKTDTTYQGKNCWYLEFDSIPALVDEDRAPYNHLLKKVLYKLEKNRNSYNKSITSYGQASQSVYGKFHDRQEKADIKALKKYLKGFPALEGLSLDHKILEIEDHIKSGIHVLESNNPELSKLRVIIPNKMASQSGITGLFVNVLEHFGIEHQIVLTSDRSISPFDKTFESYHFLTQYLLYFPDTDKFLIPNDIAYRYGSLPYNFSDNYGLFISEVDLGDFKTGVGEVKYIPPAPYSHNHVNHIVSAKIAGDFSSVHLDIENSFMGYYTSYMQPYLRTYSDDVVEELAMDMLADFSPDTEIEEWSFENDDPMYSAIKPLILRGKATNSQLIEIAGDNYIFKVGELIGTQVEMYSEKERALPVYDRFKREFMRTLTITIPDGYVVKNLDDINIKVDYQQNGETILLFHSRYEMDGQTITIHIDEYYDRISYEVGEYEPYRAVVNSASDFNKVVLVIGKR